MIGHDHLVAQARAVGDEYLELFLPLLLLLAQQALVGFEARLALGLTCLGRHAHPFELVLQCAAPA